MTSYFKIVLVFLVFLVFALAWYANSAAENLEEKEVLKGERLELFLSGDLSAKLDLVKFKYIHCTDKEIVFHSNNASPFDIELSFEDEGLKSQNWNHYSLSNTKSKSLRLNILKSRETNNAANFYALEGNLDFYEGKGYFDVFMVSDKGQRLFLSGYFQC